MFTTLHTFFVVATNYVCEIRARYNWHENMNIAKCFTSKEGHPQQGSKVSIKLSCKYNLCKLGSHALQERHRIAFPLSQISRSMTLPKWVGIFVNLFREATSDINIGQCINPFQRLSPFNLFCPTSR